MTLIEFKWLSAALIFLVSLASGFITLRLTRYRRGLRVGDAAASGVFIGAALFHMLPESTERFANAPLNFPILSALLVMLTSFVILLLFERGMLITTRGKAHWLSAWVLVLTLSIHALITGFALGLSTKLAVVSVIFVAILAHKSFEVFAFIHNLHRHLKNHSSILILLILFSLVTPLGIITGMENAIAMKVHSNALLTGCFNALAAGTFLYIATAHRHVKYPRLTTDSHHHYDQLLATIAGFTAMGILAIWL